MRESKQRRKGEKNKEKTGKEKRAKEKKTETETVCRKMKTEREKVSAPVVSWPAHELGYLRPLLRCLCPWNLTAPSAPFLHDCCSLPFLPSFLLHCPRILTPYYCIFLVWHMLPTLSYCSLNPSFSPSFYIAQENCPIVIFLHSPNANSFLPSFLSSKLL